MGQYQADVDKVTSEASHEQKQQIVKVIRHNPPKILRDKRSEGLSGLCPTNSFNIPKVGRERKETLGINDWSDPDASSTLLQSG